jgi:hypothetical protein
VQPVLDKHCVACHDFGEEAAEKLILAGDKDLFFNASYTQLWRKRYITAVGAGPAHIRAPYSWGSHASKLVQRLRKRRNAGKLDKESFDRIVTWIDINAPYYPSYYSAYPRHPGGRSPLDGNQLKRLGQLTGIDFNRENVFSRNSGPHISFDRPELSPCLARFKDKNDPRYREALAIIQAGKAMLAKRPRADMPGFVPCEADRRREAKYTRRRQIELRNRLAVRAGEKAYEKPPRPAAQ